MHNFEVSRVVRAAWITAAAVLGVLVALMAIVAADNGRTLDPTDPVNYPRCSTATAEQACQSP